MKHTLIALAVLSVSFSANAAFTCVNSNNEVITWTVEQPKPSFNLGDISKLACAASFDELNYLRDRFDGLPMKVKGGNTVIWRGYDAAFLLDNL